MRLLKSLFARKPFHQFLEALDVKYKTSVGRLGAAKAKNKATRTGNKLWSKIAKRRGHTKINQKVKEVMKLEILW